MRDEFTQNIKDTLAKRVGGICSNPTCNKSTHGPRTEHNSAISIGVAAHISAASIGGPRYDTSLSTKDRSDISNGIWLCQNCAKLIDNDQNRFTKERLFQWKQEAEARALERISGVISEPETSNNNSSELVVSMSNQETPAKAYLEFRRFENLHFPRTEMPALFDIAIIETDGAGIKIGWDVIEVSQDKFNGFDNILNRFKKSTKEIQEKNSLGYHYLSVVACGGTTTENEALSECIEHFCRNSNGTYGITILIGFMAGIRYVDRVMIGA